MDGKSPSIGHSLRVRIVAGAWPLLRWFDDRIVPETHDRRENNEVAEFSALQQGNPEAQLSEICMPRARQTRQTDDPGVRKLSMQVLAIAFAAAALAFGPGAFAAAGSSPGVSAALAAAVTD